MCGESILVRFGHDRREVPLTWHYTVQNGDLMQEFIDSWLILPLSEEVEGSQLVNNLNGEARFFSTLADQRIGQRFLRLEATARQIVFAFERTATFVNDEQRVCLETDPIDADRPEERPH